MRNVIYGAACSLDGFIARTDGAVDWLLFSRDVSDIVAANWRRFDTMLMGRKTWEVVAASGGGGTGNPYGEITTYVFSRTLQADPRPDVHLVREDAGAFLRQLKQQAGKDICIMGGGDFARSLFAAGLVDEVGINVHPVLLGSGIPLFVDAGRQTDLELVECRTIAHGCVYMSYRVRQGVRRRPRSAAGRTRKKRR